MTAPMSLLRRQRGLPGAARQAAGAPAGGMPFLVNELGDPGARLMVEAAFGADVTSTEPQLWNWIDITTDVRQASGQRVAITPVGRADEASQSQPGGCTFELDNTAAAYTANHPGSPWFPYVRRNTPIRVRLYVSGAWSTRFQGYANGWTPSYDTSCNLAVVTVSASGVLRRLAQGKTPLRSPLYQAIAGTSPIAYWPLEDGKSATQAASAVSGVPALKATSSVPKFGNVAMTGSAPVADLSGGGQLVGSVPIVSSSSWRVEFEAIFPSGGTAVGSTNGFLKVFTWFAQGTMTEWFVQVPGSGIGTNLIEVAWRPNDGSSLFELISSVNPFDGASHQYRIEATRNGGNIDIRLYIDGTLNSWWFGISGTLGPITGLAFNQLLDTSTSMPAVGHLAVWAPYSSSVDTSTAATGYAGETATQRLVRLCAASNLPLSITGASDTTMGPQTVDTLVNLLRECEATDDGLLYDGLGTGIGYVTRQARYNQTAIMSPDMSADPPQVAPPFGPTDDDQRNRNLVKVDRKNGSSATVEDSTSALGTGTIGTYDTSVTVNTRTDDVLINRAGWEVRKGTAGGFRYPSLCLDLAATPALVRAWLASPLASRIDVLNVTSKATQQPPGTVPLLLEGYSEVLGPFDWTVAATCSPYDPWRVAVIEATDDTGWRLDSGASTLAADVAAGATSLSVAVTDGYLWSTSAGDYPRSIDVGGVQVTVTAVAGVTSPQTFTCTALTYPLKAGWAVHLWRPAAIAL